MEQNAMTEEMTKEVSKKPIEEAVNADAAEYITKNHLDSKRYYDCQRIVARRNGFMTGWVSGYQQAINDLKEKWGR